MVYAFYQEVSECFYSYLNNIEYKTICFIIFFNSLNCTYFSSTLHDILTYFLNFLISISFEVYTILVG